MKSVLWVVVLCLAGCVNTVSVSEPVGRKAPEEHLGRAVGEWESPDEPQHKMLVRLSDDRELVVESLVWDEQKEEFVSEGTDVLDVRQCGPNLFLMIDAKKENAILRIVQRTPDTAEFFMADPSAFRRAVQSGKANGNVVNTDRLSFDATIEADKQLEDLLSADDVGQLFDEEPLLSLRRVDPIQHAEPGVGADSR